MEPSVKPSLAIVETNPFKYWQEEHEFDDAWWHFAQANHCTYALAPGRPLEAHLRWFVPTTTKIITPTGIQPLHDDRLISAALLKAGIIAEQTNSSATAVSSSAVPNPSSAPHTTRWTNPRPNSMIL